MILGYILVWVGTMVSMIIGYIGGKPWMDRWLSKRFAKKPAQQGGTQP